jgi:AcrR family transcriptional regulator
MRAAARILRRDGYARLTMERVAAESGVAKTTIYRRWATKAALCMDLYFDVAHRELRDPDTGDVARDLAAIAATVVRLQTRTIAGPALIGVIAEAHLKPHTRAAVLAEFASRRRAVTRRVLARAVARGEIRRDTDIDLVICSAARRSRRRSPARWSRSCSRGADRTTRRPAGTHAPRACARGHDDDQTLQRRRPPRH